MSTVVCYDCTMPFDSDDDPNCFVEVGNMKRQHSTIVLCEACRDRRLEQAEADAYLQAKHETAV